MATPTEAEPKSLIDGTLIPAADTLMYTSPADQKGTRLTKLTLVNVSGVAKTVTVWKTPGVAGAARYALAFGITVPGDGWPTDLERAEGTILNASDTLRAQCSVADSVAMHLDGIEMD
jgi:hypothetical protein